MPLLNIKCTKELSRELQKEISAMAALTLGKPEKYVMVIAETTNVWMGGHEGDAAYVEVKSIGGLDREVNHELSMKICILLEDHCGIPSDRVYITFHSFERDHWGWNKETFS